MASRKSKERKQARIQEILEHRKQRVLPSNTVAVRAEKPTERKPRPSPGESLEDQAVFARSSRDQLAIELQIEAESIAKSLEQIYRGEFDVAVEGLKGISRSSPYADWRLFIRGLIGFYNQDSETATQNWSRLDRERRPSRIASILLHAEMPDLVAEKFATPPKNRVAEAQNLRLRPDAVNAAKRIAMVSHRDKETTFSVSQVAMLTRFRDDFRSIDTEFVKTFSHACVRTAYFQPNPNVFQMLKKQTPGPVNDPNWNLFNFHYSCKFDGGEDDAKKAAKAYLDTDLPRMNGMKADLKNAIESSMHLKLAKLEFEADDSLMFSFRYAPSESVYPKVEKLIKTAIQKCSTNRDAHEMLLDTLQKQLNSRRLTKTDEEAIEKRIVIAKEDLVHAFPIDVETSLWLIDHYFDEDQLVEAESLIKKIGEQRLNDPLAKALPWKLKIRDAMRLSRRKDSLALARDALVAAEASWPTWLNQNWLPFLYAALELRSGNKIQFEKLDAAARQKCGASQAVGDVMMFAAMQQMSLPSSELKSLREVVDGLATMPEKLEFSDLCSLGSFFWDLSRAGIKHKGYRMQASRFGKAFCYLMNRENNPTIDHRFIDSCCWAASHRFWPAGNGTESPKWIQALASTEPRIAAAIVRWQLNETYRSYRLVDLKPEIALIQEAARNEKDPFYRCLFDKTVSEASAKIAALEAEAEKRRSFNSYSFLDDEDDEDDVDEDEVENVEDLCQCAKCQARRRRQQSSSAKAKNRSTSKPNSDYVQPSLFDNEDDDDDDESFYEDDSDLNDVVVPPIAIKIFSRLGPAGAQELMELSQKPNLGRDTLEAERRRTEAVRAVLLKNGISDRDASMFIAAMLNMSSPSDEAEFEGEPAPPAVILSPEEIKAKRKQREKELANRMKQRAKKGNRS